MFALEKKDIGLNTLPQLKVLCKMLRNNADKILAGEMSITITSEILLRLNEAADNLQNGLPPALSAVSAQSSKAFSAAEVEEWNYLLQLILDIVARAPVLVLHRQSNCDRKKRRDTTSSSESLPVPVRLGCFLGLTHLEISHVSLDAIQDLLKLRDQLVTLVIINCFSPKFHLQDVLEMCDTDVSVPLHWSSLKMLCLRFNNLIELDGSLRLCPALEYVDLSGNHLTATDGYLGYLMELRHVDLSYNNLVMLPSFSATAKKKLQVLILAGNRISSLNGLEEMTSLEELDISENLIASHSVLHPIRLLHRLDKLNMRGCPAVLKKGHRVMTLQYISTVALSRKFCLDGKLVKHKEIQNSRAVMSTNTIIIRPSPASPVASFCPENSSRVPSSCTEPQRGQQQAEQEDLSVLVTPSKKKKGRKKKARTMDDIPDMDTSTGGELSSKDVTPSTTPKFSSRLDAVGQLRRQQLDEENTKIQHIRRYYGESWLQVIEDQGILPRPASTSAALSDSAPKKDDVNDARPGVRGHGGQTQPSADSAIAPSHVDAAKNDKSFPTKESQLVSSPQDSSVVEESVAKLSAGCAPKKDAIFYVSEEDSDVSDVVSSAMLKSRSLSRDQSCRTEVTELEDSSTAVQKIRERVGDGCVNVNGTSLSKDHSPDMMRGNGEICDESEEQSEPFFVTLPSGDHVILTVTKRYLVEKDINLAVLDQLDLQCLESMKINGKTGVQTDKAGSEAENEVNVCLYFSHIRKDRRCRIYVMEDSITAQHFSELVHPFIDAKVEVTKKMMQAQHQCLKCNHAFTRAQARTEVLTPSIPHVGSVRDFKGTDFKEEKVVLKCPKCDSDHVVLLDLDNSQHKETASSLTLTDAKSDLFGRRHSLGQITLPLSPKAHSTPLKDHLRASEASEIYVTENQPKVARISTWKDLFVTDGPTADQRQTGDGPRVKSPMSQPIESKFHSAIKQEGEGAYLGRRRSNAFCDEQPLETRLRSNAVTSPQELLDRVAERSHSISFAGSASGDVGRRHSSVSGVLTSVAAERLTLSHPAVVATTGRAGQESSPLSIRTIQSSFQSVEKPHSSDLNRSKLSGQKNVRLDFKYASSDSNLTHQSTSSAESDLAIVNKRDSSASVVILASASSDDMLQPVDGSQLPERQTQSCDIYGGSEEKFFSYASGSSLQALPPDVQDVGAPQLCKESVEATPVGSPLSSSVCSSMVSSVYYNSLQPNASASDVFVTASDSSSTAVTLDSKEDQEVSIYKDDDENIYATARRAEQTIIQKVSVSSEVEVLTAEQEQSHLSIDDADTLSALSVSAVSGKDVFHAASASAVDRVDSSSREQADSSIDSEGLSNSTLHDLTHLEHDLKLHLMMHVFDNNEDFKFKVKTTICQYMVFEEYEGLVVVTNLKLYILQIDKVDSSRGLVSMEGLKLMEAQPHAELRRVDLGLGRQTLRLEFLSDCSSYTLVLRDTDKLELFKELLMENLETFSRETEIPMLAVFNEDVDQQTIDNLDADVLSKSGLKDALRLYALGYIARGHNAMFPVAYVVSTSEICLVRTNHQWPSPKHQAPLNSENVTKQFTVLERQKINNIAAVEVHAEYKNKLCITFFNESSGDEAQWLVTMDTVKGIQSIIYAIKGPWEDEFGIELEVAQSEFDTSYSF